MTIIVKSPSSCSEQEQKSFCNLAVQGGEVQNKGLLDLVTRAKVLAFLRIDENDVGIAGLKCPRAPYRQGVFKKSKSNFDPEDFSYELGWVYIMLHYQGQKYSRKLVEQVLKFADGQNVFATSRSTQPRMHSTLERCGFVKEGFAWTSARRPREKLLLFIRRASQVSFSEVY